MKIAPFLVFSRIILYNIILVKFGGTGPYDM